MFPLGTVLVPGMVLPLHVFEPRYRRLVQDCLAGDGEFGVVLIERGSEVGGGDVRTGAGTVARIVRAAQTPDGRYAIAALGLRRIRVLRWLEDDPYPQAEVEDWPDEGADQVSDGAARTATVATRLRRAAALCTELGEPAPPLDLELAEDLVLAGYQATAVAPLGPADKHELLCASSVPDRLDLLVRLLDDRTELLEARLASG
jgi:Lon protease-like protein